jgi:hypothetical protein
VDEVRKWSKVSPSVKRNTLDGLETRQQEVGTSYVYMVRGFLRRISLLHQMGHVRSPNSDPPEYRIISLIRYFSSNGAKMMANTNTGAFLRFSVLQVGVQPAAMSS